MPEKFANVGILGTGLIGSSLALALKSARAAPRVVGFDISGDSRRGAGGLKTRTGQKAFDGVSGNLAEAVRGAQLVIIATPVGSMELLLREIGKLAQPGTVVTDTGSTKQQVLQWAGELLPSTVEFVGGHPMAGNVSAGPWEADGELFRGATYCLCPLARTRKEAIERLIDLVNDLGAGAYFVDASEHDGLVATVSHLPYLTAVALMNVAAGGRGWREAATLAAGGFSTATHLSESDPRMFTDICLTNRAAIAWQLDQLVAELSSLRDTIAAGDESIKQRFEQAQQRHRDWLSGRAAEGGETPVQVDSSGMRPESLFLGSRLGGLLRGQSRDRDRK